MNKTPKLRFKEFSGDWESKTLGEMGQSIIGLTYSPDDISETGTLVLRSSNIKNNKIVYMDNVFVNIEIPQKIITQENDVLICSRNGSRHLIGKSALIDKCSKGNSFGAFMTIFRSNYGKFIFQLLQNENFFRQIHKNLGATINQITSKDLNSMRFYIPSKEEQEKITSFFSLIDDKISLQGEKVETLKDYKKSMMQKIFSRELRFKDDDGRDYPEWEEKKFVDIAECLDNKRKSLNSTERVKMKGSIPYYGANGVVDFVNDYIFDEDIILLAEDGGNFDDFATKPIAQFVTGKSWVNNCAHVLRAKCNAEFLFYSLVHKDIRKYTNGASATKLNKSNMSDIVVNVPKLLKEQKKIVDTLRTIYLKIEKEQEKLDYLNEYKKGLLQQMFV